MAPESGLDRHDHFRRCLTVGFRPECWSFRRRACRIERPERAQAYSRFDVERSLQSDPTGQLAGTDRTAQSGHRRFRSQHAHDIAVLVSCLFGVDALLGSRYGWFILHSSELDSAFIVYRYQLHLRIEPPCCLCEQPRAAPHTRRRAMVNTPREPYRDLGAAIAALVEARPPFPTSKNLLPNRLIRWNDGDGTCAFRSLGGSK